MLLYSLYHNIEVIEGLVHDMRFRITAGLYGLDYEDAFLSNAHSIRCEDVQSFRHDLPIYTVPIEFPPMSVVSLLAIQHRSSYDVSLWRKIVSNS